jgi:hypothetical protein
MISDQATPAKAGSSARPIKAEGAQTDQLVSIPNDHDRMAEDMEKLFAEDRVTHQHGKSEPEQIGRNNVI